MTVKHRPTAITEALRILRENGPMHYRDLAERIEDEGAVKIKGKTFKQTLSAALTRHPQVERVAPGVYTATEADDG